ncbi:hypothetical protein [Vibrio diabolicus]|uniref:Uncharacterized protein n=1 Tax=Vibrio diabolicus TaxID=50719 RepID=A0ABN5HI83_9VIBR|nr:hypothetical protein [Vibrio diabolicus]AVH25914.1 hypothetical protein AL468_01195 [Vibrio diabolicus]
MNTWRVTYNKSNTLLQGTKSIGHSHSNKCLTCSDKMELRDEHGQIARLSSGAEIKLIDDVVPALETFGEVFLKNVMVNGHQKYRTSCYSRSMDARIADYFYRPTDLPNQDEMWAVSGTMLIYEFDENNMAYPIASLREGEKAVLTFDDSKVGPERYKASVVPISDDEMDYVLKHYVDPRNWR